ncbi:MAG TPA: hypothetical protein VMM56_16740 [Planctomycetaceae bacterium]|nr:hypothetical protein [Planctomycetaceae bacterium]
MPIHLPAQSRRPFLLTVGAGLVACRSTALGDEFIAVILCVTARQWITLPESHRLNEV